MFGVSRKNIRSLLVLLFICDGVMVGAIVGGTQRSLALGLLVGLGAMLLPLVLVTLIIGGTMAAGGWGRLMQAFPAVSPLAGTVGRMAESFTVGAVPMNNAVECAADDDCLHLTPLVSLGRFCGPVSIPWEHVAFPEEGQETKGLFTGGRVAMEAAGVRMWIPTAFVARELEVRRAMGGEGMSVERP